MALKFGTDGVRGRAYEQLTLDGVARIGSAAVRVLRAERIVIARDTRESGPDFVDALACGIAAEGAVPEVLGVAPTPAVAFFAATDGIPGAMLSASHNPYYDNGVKLFAPGGLKLDDRTQVALEEELIALEAPVGDTNPQMVDVSDRLGDYAAAVAATVEGRTFGDIAVVADCANGAASHVVPTALAELGLSVHVIHASPDGRNINHGCGSTDLGDLQAAVAAHGADLGLAFDGDADRVLAVDGDGAIVDGDAIIAMCAVDRQARRLLTDDTVVVTVMTNQGFRNAMREHSIDVVDTPVGDRYVLQALEDNGWTLGGEQSGHVIFRDLATTGDGFLTAVQLIDIVSRSGQSLAALAKATMTRLPQVLLNVAFDGKVPDISEHVTAAEHQLGDRGRVLVRPSGTEPLFRVMVEAEEQDEAARVAQSLVDAVHTLTDRGRG